MASTIGTAQDYTTITAWEAALGGGGADDEGQCLDEAFDEAFTINAGTTPQLTHQVGAGHDSTEGSGARIVWSTNRTTITLAASDVLIKHIEIDGGGYNSAGVRQVQMTTSSDGGALLRCVVHDFSRDSWLYAVDMERGDVLNCFIYAMTCTNTGSSRARGVDLSNSPVYGPTAQNVTIHDIVNDNGSGDSAGLYGGNHSAADIKNVLVTDTGGTTSGTTYDFEDYGSATTATNASSDSTAPSAIAAEPVVSSVEYVSTGSPPDLRLASGAESIGAGTDLGTTPTGVNLDILLRDRDSEGDTWDLGAHQYVAAGGGISIPVVYHHRQRNF